MRLDGSDFTLISSGTRKVTFLSISVYDLGIYIALADIPQLNARLAALHIDTPEQLHAYLLDPETGSRFIESLVKEVSIAVRITPVRNTDIAHMRDGFVRGILARMDPMTESLESFKEFFPSPRKKFNKEEVMILTSWKGKKLELSIDGHDYGTYEAAGLTNAEMAQDRVGVIAAFIATYVAGKKVACEPLRTEFVQQIAQEAL